MRRFVLATIQLFGRYTVIIIFAVVCATAAIWLSYLDSYPKTVLVSGILVIPITMASIALMIGLLFSGLAKADGERLSRKEAPDLWSIWDELNGQLSSERHLQIDEEMNASIGERRKFMGLWAREVTMTIGLPLMLCLDVPALKAVIAHEVGHNELKHTSGLAKLVEFERTFETLFEFADPEETVTGAVAYFLLGGIGNWLEQEALRLSRQHEFEADHVAATREGIAEEARSMVMTEAAIEFYGEEILEGIHKELAGATKAPRPPLQQLAERLAELRAPETVSMLAERCWKKQPDPKSTHPTLKERIGAHGVAEIPDVGPIGRSAADVLLAPKTKSRLMQRFNDEWVEQADALVRIE